MIKELPSLFGGFLAVALFGVLLTGGQIDETSKATAETRAPKAATPAPRSSSPEAHSLNLAINTPSSRLP